MKLLIISSRFPYPLEKGDKLRLYHQIKLLATRAEIILISLSDVPVTDQSLAALRPYCKCIHIFRLSKTRIYINLVNGLVKGLPAQVAYFFSPTINTKIQQVIELEKPDHMYCQLIRTAEYVRTSPLPKTLDYMDCFSLSTSKRSALANVWTKSLWQYETQRTRSYEKFIYPYFNHHTIISHTDGKAMPLDDIRQPLTIIPNGISEDYLNTTLQSVRDIDILFLGNLGYFSNISAIDYIIREIMPILKSMGKQFRIVIAGAQPGRQLIQKIAQAGIELVADVAHPKDIYLRSKIFIAPIYQGTGQQNKVLEALACGCAVICSTEVQLGLNLPSPALIHVADTPADYATICTERINQYTTPDESNRKTITEYLNRHFSWGESVAKLWQLLHVSA